MQTRIKRLPLRLLVAFVTFTAGVALVMLWVVPNIQREKPPAMSGTPAALKYDEISVPDDWTELEVNKKLVLRLPRDMRPAELIGDSFRFEKAFANQDIHVTIEGDVLLPEWEEKLREKRIYSCDPPKSFVGRPEYHEALIQVDGRNAKLGIYRNQPSEGITARLCFPSADDRGFEAFLGAYCKDDRALEIAQQIFASIRFKNKK